MSSDGSHASAMAIIARWRMPPENWCGYSSMRRFALGMPTSSSSSTARLQHRPWISSVRLELISDLATDGEHRVQARQGVPKIILDLAAADTLAERRVVEADQASCRRASPTRR
ncbi:MAG: hypothetical protein U0869_04665 [Chloroflexota bacterium]